MKKTTDLIKILPFSTEFKDELLEKFDNLTLDQRSDMTDIIWDLYDSIYELRLEENIQKAFDLANKNEEKLDRTFYTRIRKQTEDELEKEFTVTETKVDLSEAREELQEILSKQTS